jgi:hypothetical protein
MGADIENPDDGGDYVAAAAKEDADAMTIKRYPTDEAFCWSMAFMCCYLLAMVWSFEYPAVKSDPALITFFVKLDLCMLLLLCFLFVLICLVVHYCFGTDPFKKKEDA